MFLYMQTGAWTQLRRLLRLDFALGPGEVAGIASTTPAARQNAAQRMSRKMSAATVLQKEVGAASLNPSLHSNGQEINSEYNYTYSPYSSFQSQSAKSACGDGRLTATTDEQDWVRRACLEP